MEETTDRCALEAAAGLEQDAMHLPLCWLQQHRGDGLKLVVMSATLDAAKFVSYFHGAKAAYLQVTLRAARCEWFARPCLQNYDMWVKMGCNGTLR